MMDTPKIIASLLLQIKAIKLSPTNPFTWASGWKSPIYCDNRLTLSYPEVRDTIRDEFVMQIRKQYPDTELIAGVATGAIAHGALVADQLQLPFVYVRSGKKEHGRANRIEGETQRGAKTVIIEDLVSTGGSSLSAYAALRDAGLEVSGMLAIFTYSFSMARENFRKVACPLTTLTDYEVLIQLAKEAGYVSEKELDLLRDWRDQPDQWSGV